MWICHKCNDFNYTYQGLKCVMSKKNMETFIFLLEDLSSGFHSLSHAPLLFGRVFHSVPPALLNNQLIDTTETLLLSYTHW